MRAEQAIGRFARLTSAMVVCAVLASAGFAGLVRAQSPNGDAAVKAKFTVMLSRFVQWPPGALAAEPAPLRLCVLHNSPTVAAAFARHAGESVGGHTVTVVPNPVAEPAACNVVFVDVSAGRAAAAAIGRAAGTPVLVVGAVDGFVLQGGMVELVNVNDALRFDVNLAAVRAANLGLSSQVLKLARQVRD